MGAIAILSDAVIWAASGTFLTAKLAKIDFLTIVTFRALFAVAFVVPAIFVLGSQGELWHMDPNTVWQLALAGLLAYVVAEPAYTLTLSFLGLTRGYTAVIGLNSVGSFVLPAIFLGEAIGWRDALGGLIIISGVYLVAFYGRAAVPTLDPATLLRQPPSFTLGSARPNLRPGGRRRSRLPFLARPFSSPPFPPSPVSSAEEPVRPIAGGSAAAAAGSNAAATRVRIPGLGITLPRLVVGLIIAFITALGWSGDATVLRAVSPGLDAAPVALMQLWPAMLILRPLADDRPARPAPRRAAVQRHHHADRHDRRAHHGPRHHAGDRLGAGHRRGSHRRPLRDVHDLRAAVGRDLPEGARHALGILGCRRRSGGRHRPSDLSPRSDRDPGSATRG